MRLVEIATNRRVTVSMFIITIVLFGMVGLSRLRVTLLPDLSYPSLTIRTTLEGAAPEEIETLLSKPLEETAGVVKNLKSVRSVSRAGQSDVTLEFNWGTNMDLASVDVREKIDILQLPEEADKPIILRFDPASEPIMRYALVTQEIDTETSSAQQLNEVEGLKRLRRFADERLKSDLESLEGTASVKISGGYEDEIQIIVDQDKLAQKGLSIQNIADRLQQENINMSGGQIEENSRRFQVRTVNQFESLDDIRNTVVTLTDNQPTYLHELADVQMLYKERKAIIRVDGREAIEMALYKEGDANTVKVAELVRKRIQRYAPQKSSVDVVEEDKPTDDDTSNQAQTESDNKSSTDDKATEILPLNSSLKLVQDQSIFINDAINQVRSAALLGGLFAIMILYVFLRHAWSTIIIGLTIPVSVIGTFFLMYLMDLSLNIMSMGGIALAIGLLVDNSIVVLENIAQKREQGLARVQAAREGTSQVAMAVTASTFTTVAVFFPMVFISGIAGQLFKDQALTISSALLFSLIIALTMIPMLSTLFADKRREEEPLDLKEKRSRYVLSFIPLYIAKICRWILKGLFFILHYLLLPLVWLFNKFYSALASLYQPLLRWSLSNRFIVVFVSVTIFVLTLTLIPKLGTELIPQLAQGEFYADVRLAPGSPINSTDSILKQAREILGNDERISLTSSVAGSGNRLDASPVDSGDNTGRFNIKLNSGGDEQTETKIINELRTQLDRLPGVSYEFGRPELVSFNTPLQVEVGGYDLVHLNQASEAIMQVMRDTELFSDIRSSVELGQPEIQIITDPQKASNLGLNERDVANSIVNKVRGKIATRYSWRDRKIDVSIRSLDSTNTSREEIEQLIINPQSERPVTLSSVAEIRETLGPASITRMNQQRVALITASVKTGDIGSAVSTLQLDMNDLRLPQGVSAVIKGQSQDMQEAFSSMRFALLLAVFLVYLVMASQFESLLHPFVILFTIPMALIGSILALYITGTTINVVALIGLIMLAGIVVNNGIVLVDLINQYRQEGRDKLSAILDGGRDRLRPILMTALTTVLGLIPMAIGIGEGAEIRTPMAITVIGGMIVATFLTLIVIPVMYSLLDHKKYSVPESMLEV